MRLWVQDPLSTVFNLPVKRSSVLSETCFSIISLFLHRGFSHHFVEKILDHRGTLSNEYLSVDYVYSVFFKRTNGVCLVWSNTSYKSLDFDGR